MAEHVHVRLYRRAGKMEDRKIEDRKIRQHSIFLSSIFLSSICLLHRLAPLLAFV
jgi:uncharacterized membrane protein YGL010W